MGEGRVRLDGREGVRGTGMATKGGYGRVR